MSSDKTDPDRELSEPKKRFPWALVLRIVFKVLAWVVRLISLLSRFADIDKMFMD